MSCESLRIQSINATLTSHQVVQVHFADAERRGLEFSIVLIHQRSTGQRVEIHDYTEQWVREFEEIGDSLRSALAESAIRIDHIGSTSIPGLAAKPIIDIQVSVMALEPMDVYQAKIQSAGYEWRRDNPERSKRYFREQPGGRRTHIHVRKLGSWHEQYALLFRDYVRTHPEARVRYEQVKRELAAQFQYDRYQYTEAKAPIFWEIMQKADRWVAATGWEPGPTDR